MYLLLLILVITVLVSSDEYWYHHGCFEVGKLEVVENLHWAECASVAVAGGLNTIALLNNSQCFTCKDCVDFPPNNVVCPDYGIEFGAQIFVIKNDSESIPEQYQECSRHDSLRRCTGLHPLAYRRHSDVANFMINRHPRFILISSLLPPEQNCHGNAEGYCEWGVQPVHRDVCESEFLHILESSKLPVIWPPPEVIPEALLSYLQGRSIPLLFLYQSQKHAEGISSMWSQSEINKSLQSIRSKQIFEIVHSMGWMVLTYYSEYIRNMTGLVLGSVDPWIEANLLKAGAKHIITVEYKPILSLVPDITTLTPVQLASRYLADNWSPVDFAFSYSSIEHSGLGRYGDPVDSEGDLRAMRQISCLLKPGGVLFLSVPTGPDALVYNAHRIYGRHRLPVLFEGWQFLDVFGDGIDVDHYPHPLRLLEPIYVLRKPLE